MNNFILVLSLLFFTTLSFCQSKNYIGLDALFTKGNGTNIECSFSHHINTNFFLSARVRTNTDWELGYSVGVGYKLYFFDKVESSLGIEYSYQDGSEFDWAISGKQTHSLQLPFQIGYNLSQSIQLFGGIVPSYSLEKSILRGDTRIYINSRVGFQYLF